MPEAEHSYRQANVHAQRGEYAEALRLYDLAIQAAPLHGKARGNRGTVRIQVGDYAGAISDLDVAIRVLPNDSLAYSNRGMAKSHLGDLAGAIEDFTAAIRVDPRDAAARINRAEAYVHVGLEEKATEDLDQALKIRQDAATLDAVARLRAKLRARTDAAGSADRAEALFRNEDLAGTEKAATEAIQLNDRNGPAYLWRAAARLGRGDERGATSDFDRGLSLFQVHGRRELQNGWELFREGRTALAIEMLRSANCPHPAVTALIDWLTRR